MKLVSKLDNVAVIRTFELMAIAMMMIIKFHIYHLDRDDDKQTAKETSVSPSNHQILHVNVFTDYVFICSRTYGRHAERDLLPKQQLICFADFSCIVYLLHTLFVA